MNLRSKNTGAPWVPEPCRCLRRPATKQMWMNCTPRRSSAWKCNAVPGVYGNIWIVPTNGHSLHSLLLRDRCSLGHCVAWSNDNEKAENPHMILSHNSLARNTNCSQLSAADVMGKGLDYIRDIGDEIPQSPLCPPEASASIGASS